MRTCVQEFYFTRSSDTYWTGKLRRNGGSISDSTHVCCFIIIIIILTGKLAVYWKSAGRCSAIGSLYLYAVVIIPFKNYVTTARADEITCDLHINRLPMPIHTAELY